MAGITVFERREKNVFVSTFVITPPVEDYTVSPALPLAADFVPEGRMFMAYRVVLEQEKPSWENSMVAIGFNGKMITDMRPSHGMQLPFQGNFIAPKMVEYAEYKTRDITKFFANIRAGSPLTLTVINLGSDIGQLTASIYWMRGGLQFWKNGWYLDANGGLWESEEDESIGQPLGTYGNLDNGDGTMTVAFNAHAEPLIPSEYIAEILPIPEGYATTGRGYKIFLDKAIARDLRMID